jgi:uncharacterized circularly permuted ATP-grasp superfamily protein/uncharacterized alpha-E superfamily protein
LTLQLSAPPATGERLTTGYRPLAGIFDELVGQDGQPRPHWRPFLERFEAIGADGREVIGRTTEQKLLESGIAFNVHADPDDRQAAWRLDLLPVILDAADWRVLEAGLKQRARLIEAVLQDLYGPQRLLRSGVLPPALVFGNPEYLHACSGWPQPPKRFLHVFACDVARDGAGGWRVLADQIDAPAGNGWLLASRVALSQGLGELYLESRVRRVASFYARLQSGLQAAAPGDDGRIVVLSPGSEDPGFFSHAYLARYLGYALVEPADLTERDGQLYLKTLEGLQRVDLVIRKVAGRFADPLNLPNRTGGGTPGLVQAARLGRTVIANALGAGVLQNRALAAHANALAETLLGEPSSLREATALWLGDPDAQAQVLAEPGWVVSRLTARHDPGVVGDRVDPLPRLPDDDARRRFLAREGHLWIAERPTPLPTTPGFDGRALRPVHWAMRAFVAIDDEGCHVLPGGLVRQAADAAVVGLPNGHGSKDLWILREPDDVLAPSILTRRFAAVHLRRTGRDLLSRTAENLFWLGRYTERAETVLRVLRAVLSRLIEDGGPDRQPELLETLLAIHLPGMTTAEGSPRARIGQALEALLHHHEPPYGMRRSIDGSRRNATLARGVLSQDGWRILNALFNDRRWRKGARPVLAAPPIDLVNDAIHQLVAFAGTAAENMTRNYSWRFLDIGTRLERALEMVEVVAALAGRRHAGVDETMALTALLEIGDSYMTYRSRYAVTPMPIPVIDLLLLDESNPRSLAFQLVALEGHLAALPHDGPYRPPALRKVLGVLTELRLADPDRLVEDEAGERLQAFFSRARADLGAVSDLVGRAYFVLAETPTSTFATRRGASSEATDL